MSTSDQPPVEVAAAPTCEKCGGRLARGVHCNLCEMFAAAAPPGGDRPAGWPMASDSMAVDPTQIPAAMERDRKHGLAVTYLPDGRAVYENPGQRYRHMKSLGFHDQNGGYRG